MNLDRISALAAAIGKGLVAFADSLAGAAPQVAPVPTAPPSPPAPAQPSPVALALENLRKDLAAIDAPPPRKTRKRKQRLPKRYLPDGGWGPDYTDEDGRGYLSQRGAAERLGVRPLHIVAIENAGKLERHLVDGKVCYAFDDVERLALMAKEHQAKQEVRQAGTATTPTTTDEPSPPDRA